MKAARVGPWAAAVSALALVVRAIWLPRIFTPQGWMSPHGGDGYYHLRRIGYAVARPGELIERDPYVAFPAAGEIVWPPGFDLAVAFLARVFVGEDQAAVEAFAAWVPAVLGAATAAAVVVLGARLFSPAAGLAAGLLFALLPAHYTFSQLGKVDHHAAVSLASVLLVLGCTAAVRRGPRPWPGLAVGLGAGLAGLLYLWAGGLLLIALLQGAAAVWIFQAPDRATAVRRALHLAVVQGVAALLLAPYALGRSWEQYGSWSPLVLCSFQPVWLAATGGACGALALLWQRSGLGDRPARRWLSALALAGIGLALALLAVPGLAAALDQAAGWFRKDEQFQTGIAELQPLFAALDGSRVRHGERLFTRLLYLFPPALGWVAWRGYRARRADRLLLALWAGAYGVGVLAQIRFMNGFAAPYTLVMGAGLVALVAWLRPRVSATARPAAAVGLGLLLVFAAWPSGRYYGARAAVWWRGPAASAPTAYIRALAYRSAARWLGGHSPETRGWLDVGVQPEYATLVRWDAGHLVRYESRRPQVQDNLGVYVGREQHEAAQRYLAAEDEAAALAQLEALGVRYVMVDRSAPAEASSPRAMARRLYRAGLPAERRSAGTARRLPPLSHHRLVFETPAGRPGIWHVMVYEVVPGARVVGSAPPGTRIEVSLPLVSAQRTEGLLWRAVAHAASDGAFALTVPYATGGEGAVRAGSGYQLRCPGAESTVAVPEFAVRQGKRVSAPTLACAPPGAPAQPTGAPSG